MSNKIVFWKHKNRKQWVDWAKTIPFHSPNLVNSTLIHFVYFQPVISRHRHVYLIRFQSHYFCHFYCYYFSSRKCCHAPRRPVLGCWFRQESHTRRCFDKTRCSCEGNQSIGECEMYFNRTVTHFLFLSGFGCRRYQNQRSGNQMRRRGNPIEVHRIGSMRCRFEINDWAAYRHVWQLSCGHCLQFFGDSQCLRMVETRADVGQKASVHV